MESSETDIKYTVRFRKDTDAAVEFLKEEFDAFFFNCHGKTFIPEITYGIVKKITEYPLVDEDVYEVSYVLSYADKKMNRRVDFFIAEVCRKWCETTTLPDVPRWLMPSINERFNHGVRKTDKNVKCAAYAFGTFPSMCTFMQHYTFRDMRDSEVVASFFYPQRYFALHFRMAHKEGCHENMCAFKFEVKFDMIFRVVVHNNPVASNVELFFHLVHPAFVFVDVRDEAAAEVEQNFSKTLTERILSARWERTVHFGCRCNFTHCHVRRIGRTSILKLILPDKYQACRIVDQLAQKCGEKIEIFYGIVKTVPVKTLLTKDLEHFHYFPRPVRPTSSKGKRWNLNWEKLFDCQYAWQAMFSLSFVLRDQLALKQEVNKDAVRSLKEKVLQYAEEDHIALSEALTHIFHMINKNCIFDFEKALATLFFHCSLHKTQLELPPGMCLIRRAVVTPSMQIFLPLTEHFDNRVIREFGTEYMLRLSFQDDNFSKLTYAVQFNSRKEQFMQEVVGNVLTNGFNIGCRQYEVLASSNSQLREHGMWMYAKDEKQRDASAIREWMGNFSHLPNVAKYMARMGQCFSTSDSAVQVSLEKSNEIYIKDVTSHNGHHVFSDGIGMISEDLAQEVRSASNEGTSRNAYEPSAFQIRYKGVKGMVVVNPQLSGRKIGIRPSMKKFDCENSSVLEIIKISAPRRLFLNRPLISIMEQLGVPEKSFLNLQMEMVFDLTNSLLDETKAALILQDHINLSIPFMKLKDSGFSLTSDPFFRSLLLGIYKQSIDMLKKKIRIAVPPGFGRNMMGVLDETKTLKYGQVFVQYSEKLAEVVSPLKILTGDVLVTKNPCMHPGDVRKFRAVDVEELHHIKDCIVFPAKGRRPHPDEMAGSDLDGDEYVVIWKPDLIFSRQNVRPMDYAVQHEQRTEGQIGVAQMVQFFCEYIMNDQIGIFANAHLAWSDLHSKGVFSDKCMKIAHVYPFVLDFAKTGYSAEPGSIQRPPRYPDFMGKGAVSDSYRSEKVLGSLYRINRHLQACVDKIDVNDKFLACSPDPDLEYPGWRKYEDFAEGLKVEYLESVDAILNRCGVQSVAAALTGNLGGNLYDRNRYDYEEKKCILATYLRHTVSKFKAKFLNAIEMECMNCSQTAKEKMISKFQRASAIYMVVYGKSESCAMGLPWSVSDVLLEMKREKLKSKSMSLLLSKCSLTNSEDATIEKMFYNVLTVQVPRIHCRCVHHCEIILRKWLSFSGLNLCATKTEFCLECFNRIFGSFRDTCGNRCCSDSANEFCTCSVSCSTLTLTFRFLKFCITDVSEPLGECAKSECRGFNEGNLKIVALQAFANLAITRNVRYLGLQTDECEIINDDDTEGELVKLPVNDRLQEIFSKHRNKVISFFKERTGVKAVDIDTEEDKRGKWHLLISSVGKSWQRCNFEELILNRNLVEILENVVS